MLQRDATNVGQGREKLFTANFVIACLIALAFSFSFMLLLPVLPLYLKDFGGPDEAVGLIMGMTAATALVVRPWVGRLADERGRKPLLLFGGLVYGLVGVIYPFTRAVPPLLGVRALHGLGLSSYTTSANALAADLAPPHRRGEAMGYFGTTMNLSMATAPALGIWLADSVGFTAVFLASAAAAALGIALALSIKETRRVTASTVRSELISREALFPAFLGICLTATYGAIVSFLPVFAKDEGMSNPGIFFTAYALTIIVVRVVSGRASDRFGRIAVLVPGMVTLTAGMWLLATASSTATILGVAVLYGAGFGAVQPTLLAMVADRAKGGRQGAAMGTFTGSFDLGIGGGSVLWGALLVFTDLRGMFLIAGLPPLLALSVLALRQRRAEPLPAPGEG